MLFSIAHRAVLTAFNRSVLIGIVGGLGGYTLSPALPAFSYTYDSFTAAQTASLIYGAVGGVGTTFVLWLLVLYVRTANTHNADDMAHGFLRPSIFISAVLVLAGAVSIIVCVLYYPQYLRSAVLITFVLFGLLTAFKCGLDILEVNELCHPNSRWHFGVATWLGGVVGILLWGALVTIRILLSLNSA